MDPKSCTLFTNKITCSIRRFQTLLRNGIYFEYYLLFLPFILPDEHVTFFLSITFVASINQFFIHSISQLHSYGLSDIHNLMVLFMFAIVAGRVFNLFPLISRLFTLCMISSTAVSLISVMLLELKSSKVMLFR